MKDYLLTPDGDLYIDEYGDIALTDSVSQAIIIRLKWFWKEWKFNPSFGVPYYEDILIKNPSKVHVQQLIREQIMSVDEVEEVNKISLKIDQRTRKAILSFEATAQGKLLKEEVFLDV